MMSGLSRREFLKSSMAAGAAMVMAAPFSKVRGVNDDIRVGVVGVGRQGSNHTIFFHKIPGVRVVAVCDADQRHIKETTKKFKKNYKQQVKNYIDARKLLDDKEIDVITSATPNHWHALVTIWACQAGKDVYIEKPASHEIWEGRKMIEAARKYSRIVQTGTQNRSDEGLIEAFQYIHQGNLGQIKWVRGFCYKMRASIGKVKRPQPISESVDYNLWCGPANMEPLKRKNLHYDWHWVWNTGNGELGNQSIHEVDLCRWVLKQEKLAPAVMSIGGRFGRDDDAETPNTQIVFFDYRPAPFIFEVRGLPRKKGDSTEDNYRGTSVGIAVQCEQGYFVGGSGGGWAYDSTGRKIKQFKGDGGSGHHANFFKAVRSRNFEDLNADIEEGHISSALCHMGNISYRIGQQISPREIAERIMDNRKMLDSFVRFWGHLEANGVDINKTPAVMSPMLKMDPEKEEFAGEYSEQANIFVKRKYREPFVIPDEV